MRWVAFLGGINVGGHRVKMERLRALFEELGLARVETFIASGNVIFEAEIADTAALEDRIEAHLRAALGYGVPTCIRSLADAAAAAAFEPFPEEDPGGSGHTVQVLFLRRPLDAEAREAVSAIRTEVDAFHACEREVYWLCRGRITDTQVKSAVLGAALGKTPATARNATTVRKLVARLGSEATVTARPRQR
jgi:uncharacterized protein (DUF1697 family)